MSITAQMVKELRIKSSAGMMDCKKALSETNGDMDAAVDWLRKKGLATASKKSGRVASEGLIGICIEDNLGSIVEVNSETDFVARNEDFQNTVKTVAELALVNNGKIDQLLSAKIPDKGRDVSEEMTHLIATIGENISLRRTTSISINDGVVASYMHAASSPGLGRIGVIVGLESEGDSEKLEQFGHQLAMHIAAANPLSVSVNDLDVELVEKEKVVLAEQAKDSGKPDNIIEKMVEGRIRKYFEEIVLLNQTWVIDGESKVSNIIEGFEKEIDSKIKITEFARYSLGEGIEREDIDFADEVAETLNS